MLCAFIIISFSLSFQRNEAGSSTAMEYMGWKHSIDRGSALNATSQCKAIVKLWTAPETKEKTPRRTQMKLEKMKKEEQTNNQATCNLVLLL